MIDIKISKRPSECPTCGQPVEDEALGCTACNPPAPEPAAAPAPEPAAAPAGPAEDHHGHTHKIPPGEEPRWLDDDENVKKLARGVYAVAGFMLLWEALDLVGVLYHKHVHEGLPWEGWVGFYPVYGFVAYSLVVVLGLGLRKLVMRREDYYDE